MLVGVSVCESISSVWSCPFPSKFRPHVLSKNEFKNWESTLHSFPPRPPSPLLAAPPCFPAFGLSASHHITASSCHTLHLFTSLFSSVRSHVSLGNFNPTTAWGQVQRSMKWMMGNWVPAENIRRDLLTCCLCETQWAKGRKCTVGKESKAKEP